MDKRMKTIRLIIIFCVASTIAAATQLSQAFRTSNDFTIHLPVEWHEIPKSEIDHKLNEIYSQHPNAPRDNFDYAYQLASSEDWFEYPYIMIQVRHSGKLAHQPAEAFRQMKAQFIDKLKQQTDETMEQFEGSFLESASLDDRLVDWDSTNNVIWMVQRSIVENIGPVATVMAICLTETGVIRAGLAVKESEFAKYLPMYRQIVNSIQYGPTLKYKPEQQDLLEKTNSEIRKSTVRRLIEKAGSIFMLCLVFVLISSATAGFKHLFGSKPSDEQS